MTAYLKLMRCLIAGVSIVMLAGCSFLSPVKSDVQNKYLIKKIPDFVPVKKPRSIVLLVNMPETATVFNTTQMAYTIKPYQIAYFSLNRWAETPAEMFQPLLVRTMENTHHFKAIVTPPYSGHFDYVLNTEILELLQDYTHSMPVMIMTVRMQIIRESSNRVIGTRQFSVIQPIPQRSPYAGVFAANYASAHILQRIAVFCLASI